MLTEPFTKVIREIESLSDKEQNVLANLISDELNWEKTIAKSHYLLSVLAGEALNEHKKGFTKPICVLNQ
jgi:hypothetical protein